MTYRALFYVVAIRSKGLLYCIKFSSLRWPVELLSLELIVLRIESSCVEGDPCAIEAILSSLVGAVEFPIVR